MRYLLDKCSLASVCLPAEHSPETPWEMIARGPYNLWECIWTAYQQWKQFRCPALDEYSIEVTTNEELYVLLGEKRWKRK